jgi:phosphate transport system permease protein
MVTEHKRVQAHAGSLGDDEVRRAIGRSRKIDTLYAVGGIISLVIALSLLFALIGDLVADGIGRISVEFLTNYPSRRPLQSGILSAWIGTTLVMLVTACLAIPLGVAAGLYLEEYAPKNWITALIEINVSNLAGVPSIVYGLLALGLFVYGLGMGQSILVAGMVLALLILPVVIVATRESVRSIPQHVKEGAYALGAEQWQVMWNYILPTARPGILTGGIIGLSRAIGETAPLITIGALAFIAFLPPSPVQSEPPFINFDWLWSDFTVMPIQMFNWISRPQADFHTNAAATGVILIVMTLAMNAIAIWIRIRLRRQNKK